MSIKYEIEKEKLEEIRQERSKRNNKKRNDKENGFDFQHNNSLNYRYCITNFQKQTVFLDIIHNIIKKRK